MLITQNGEAKAVIQDIRSYEDTQEALALLKLIAIGEREIAEGKTNAAEEVFSELCEKYKLS